MPPWLPSLLAMLVLAALGALGGFAVGWGATRALHGVMQDEIKRLRDQVEVLQDAVHDLQTSEKVRQALEQNAGRILPP